ncbi:MAG: rhodanese-like domain-containing protein [Bacteroidota bacterium]|nr:rhodanese-like domain-containing protein [Bacteroidota bacterium]
MEHKDIDALNFKKMHEENSHVLLDVRTPEEYDAGHLKGASNINFYNENFEADLDELDKRKKYLVYCKSGGRSRQAMFLMRDLGFDEVYNLAGGIISWHEHGFEVKK